MIVTSPKVGVIDDVATLKQAADWIRRLAIDGLHEGFIDAIGHDQVTDLALRFEEMRERTRRTGLLVGAGECATEQFRRRV